MAFVDAGWMIAGRYRLDQRLDAGGRAQVWLATDLELNRSVAIKILLAPESAADAFSEAFRAEATLEARMKHPGIVEVFDWGQDGAVSYVVQELLEGQTLRQLLAEGPLSPDRVIDMGRQAAAALAYAHEQGIAHGSIGPDHIIIGTDGRVTLIDFGLQCRGVCEYPALPDSDTYALGNLLYIALTGTSPSGPRPIGVPESEPWPAAVHKLNTAVPTNLNHVVMSAIAPNPDDRYATASDLQAALDGLARPKRRVWLWVALAIVVAAIAGAGTWYFLSQPRVVVPDVSGMTESQAQAKLSASGLTMVVTGRAPSTTVATGTVISEDPAAGKNVRRGSQISVVLSAGVPRKAVPSVTGISLEAASSNIASAGLVVGKISRKNSTTFPTGTVMAQSPSAGELVGSGSSVNLTVSAGIAQVTVPSVTGSSRDAARDKLTNAGLVADIATAYSSTPGGVVISQVPAAGTTTARGGTVTITVSKGPAPISVPNVVGATAAAAATSLQNVGLVPVSVPASGTPAQVGTVIDQSPLAGQKADPGSQVKIYVGR